MKLSLVRGRHNPPLRTVKEMADEIGISTKSLANYLSHDEASPRPRICGKDRVHKGRINWYVRAEVLRWWAAKK